MALKIRLARGGAKKRPFYRIVVSDSRKPRDGRFIERLGTYNPLLAKDNEERVKLNVERIQHWLDVGAKPSDRVASFLGQADIIPISKRNNPNKAKPKAKAQERAAALKEAEEAAAAEAAEAAAAPAEEAAADEAVAESGDAEAKSEG
mgnify:CR=1 FL=1|jgi:small subunit ribosomal protein S16